MSRFVHDPLSEKKEKRGSRTVQQIRWVPWWITGGNLPRSIPEAIWGKPPVSVVEQSKPPNDDFHFNKSQR